MSLSCEKYISGSSYLNLVALAALEELSLINSSLPQLKLTQSVVLVFLFLFYCHIAILFSQLFQSHHRYNTMKICQGHQLSLIDG